MKWQALILLCAFVFTARATYDAELEELTKAEDSIDSILKSLDELSGIEDEELEDGSNEETIYEKIEHLNEGSDVVAEEELEEMDIKTENDNGNGKRNALRDTRKLWYHRDIAYVLDSTLTASKKTIITNAINDMASQTCIKFHVRRANDTGTYLNIKSAGGCWSYVGKTSRTQQDLSIGDGCQYKGIIQHELLHALGFYHEQSRYDRDTYVEIKWENIQSGREGNFRIQSKLSTRNTGTGYDFDSVMHYGKTAFSKNGKATIEVIGNSQQYLGQRSKMSQTDLDSLNRLYHCDTNKQVLAADQWTGWSDYGGCHIFRAGETCRKKRYRFCSTFDQCACDTTTNVTLCNEQVEDCQPSSCYADGNWGVWSSWSACSATTNCAKGVKTRTRQCNNPPPTAGGKACNGTGTGSSVCEALCPRECTFDDGNNCGYTTSGRFYRKKGTTPSSGTGPSSDFSGTGEYMFTEASTPGYPYKKSTLLSPVFQATGSPQCFSMRYHMYGSDIGSLTVIVIDGTAAPRQVWQMQGNQGNQWFKAQFNIISAAPFRISLNATSGKSYRGDLAVDNLFLNRTLCDTVTSTIAPPVTTTPSPDGNWGAWSKWSACSATADCAKGVKTRTRQCNNPPPTAAGKSCVGTGTNSLICQTSCPRHCTFDDGNNCGYTTSGRFLRRKGSTPSSLTGPTSDYSGTGEYMFTETSSPGYPNKVSTLKSPVFQPTGSPQCFSMRYHMYGANIGILTVIVLSNGTAAPRQVWQRQGQQGNQWFKAQFNIISATPFRILINGTSGNGYRGDIAVDNLFLNRTSCAGTVFTSTSAPVTSTIGPGSSTSSPWSSTSNPGSSTSSPWSSTYRPPRSTSGPWSSTYRPPYSTSGPWSSTSGPSTTVQPIPPNSILAFNVSFDGSMGGMVNQAPFPGAAIGKTHWKLRSSVNTWIGSAPITDRVFEGGSFLAVTGEDDSDVGRIVAVSSQSMNGTGSTSLIEFYYNMWTGSLKSGSFAKMGVLSVDVIVGGGLPQTIFRTFDGHNGAWQYARAKVDVPAGSKFHLVFKATLGSAPMMIAIDDIKGLPHTTSTFLFQKVFSPSALACSFSNQANSSCYWRLGGDFKWKPQHGETPSQDTGPDSPGSVTGSKQHRYLYAEATGRNPGDSATMYSGFIYSKRPMCMYLYSNTHGDGRLTGGIRTSKRSQVVHDLTKNTWSGKWQFNFVPLPVNKFFMVVINATVGTSYKSDVALDNIFVAPGRCVNHSSAYKLICDFDATTKCLGVNSKGFKIASDNSGSNKYFKAKHDSGNATILIGLTVDQAGACLTYQYRITPRDPSSQALVRYRMMAHGRTLMEGKLKPEAEGGKDWKYFMKTIPPRSKKEKVMVQFAASFNGLHSVAEIDIDDIHVQQRMCPDYGQASAPATVAKGVPMAY